MDLPVAVRLPEPSTTMAPIALRHLVPAKVSEVYESYWRFAAERQAVFFRRARGEAHPWTDNPVLAIYKFTNAYRASDRVNQLSMAETNCVKGRRESVPVGLREKGFEAPIYFCASMSIHTLVERSPSFGVFGFRLLS